MMRVLYPNRIARLNAYFGKRPTPIRRRTPVLTVGTKWRDRAAAIKRGESWQ